MAGACLGREGGRSWSKARARRSAATPFRIPRPGRFVVAAVVVAISALTLTSCKLSPPQVILYGDSLSVQSAPYFNWFTVNAQPSTVVENVAAGSAPCHWLDQMLADARTGVMSVAVIEFSGNAFGCMNYPPSSPAYYDAYQQQVTEAVSAFSAADVHTFLIGAPMTYREVITGDLNWDHLNEIYAAIAASVPNTTFVNGGASVEEDQQFAWRLPCLPIESYCSPGGQNIVRAADGGHFCPQDPNAGGACGAWDSGAIRYGVLMATAVDQFLSSGSAPTYEGPPLRPPNSPAVLAPGQTYPYGGAPSALTTVNPLTSGESLQSVDGVFTGTMQSDGNFVVSGPFGPIWSTNTAGSGATQLVLQSDGNLVLYAGSRAVWFTATAGTSGDYLIVQQNGALALYGESGILWKSPESELAEPEIVGVAPSPAGDGYWLVGAEGGVMAFGQATDAGSMLGRRLNAAIVGMASTPTGQGYWLVAADGGVFSFGDAAFHGSTGSLRLNQPIVGMAADPATGGYWLVAADNGVFGFDAGVFGSVAAGDTDDPTIGLAATPSGQGYWLSTSDGTVSHNGDAPFLGSFG